MGYAQGSKSKGVFIRRTPSILLRLLRLTVFTVLTLAAQATHAETHKIDSSNIYAMPTYLEPGGLQRTCYAPHKVSGKLVPVIGIKVATSAYYGFATHDDDGWPIMLFSTRLDTLPVSISRFTYYHECAHLAKPTSNEVMANCIALLQMRENGDLKPEEEIVVASFVTSFPKLGSQYSGGNPKKFWADTLECADEPQQWLVNN